MNYMLFFCRVVLVFVFFLASSSSFAGVMLRERENGFNYSTLFQDNVIYYFDGGRLMARLDLERNHCAIALEEVITQGACNQMVKEIRALQQGAALSNGASAKASPANRVQQKLTLIEAEMTEISGYPAQRYDLVYEGNVVQSVWASAQLRRLIDAEIHSSYVESLRDVWREVRVDDSSLASELVKQIEKIGATQEIMRLAKPASPAADFLEDLQVDRQVIDVELDQFNVDDYQFPEDLQPVSVKQLLSMFRPSDANVWFRK